MKNYWYLIVIFCISITSKLVARSCSISNILLQPGGYYAFDYKDTLLNCPKTCYDERSWYTRLVNESSQPQSNTYYDRLVQDTCTTRFHFQALLYGCVADKGFNNKNAKVPLADLIFSRSFTIEDVHLASRLSREGKLTLPSVPGQVPPFGSSPNEQYIALLAPSLVKMETDQHEVGLNLTTLYHFHVPCTENMVGVLGLMVPIIHQKHELCFGLEGGMLLANLPAPPIGIAQETTLTQFFTFFESANDFFLRGVIQGKNLQCIKQQRKIGIGDIVGLAALDVAQCSEHVAAALVGMQFVFPSGNARKGDVIWPIELGNGGSYQFEPFINLYIDGNCWINPVLYAGARFSTDFTGIRRIPKVKTGGPGQPLVNTEVIVPPGFEQFIVNPATSFAEFDTKVLQFADQAVRAKIDPGTEFLFRLGNFYWDFLIDCLDLGLFYDMYLQGKGNVRVLEPGTFDTKLIEQTLRSTQHLISWRLGYTHHEYLEAYVGSQHVVAGKNVPQDHKIFASISAYF